MKPILFAFFIILGQNTFAQVEEFKCDKSIDLKKIETPAVILNSVVRGSVPVGKFILPVPQNACVSVGMNIEIRDPYGDLAGTAKVTSQWRGPLSVNLIPPGDQGAVFRSFIAQLDSWSIGLRDGTDVILRALFQAKLGTQSSLPDIVQLVEMEFRATDGYYFDEYSLAKGERSIAAVTYVDYANMILRIRDGVPIFRISENLHSDESKWRIPTSKSIPGYLPDLKKNLVNLNYFVRVISQSVNAKEKACPKEEAAFYGPLFISPELFNLTDWLHAVGCKKLDWFQGGRLDWQTAEKREKTISRITPKVRMSGDEVAKVLTDSNTLIVDTRDGASFARGHIPGAKNAVLLETATPFRPHLQLLPYMRFSDTDRQHFRELTKTKTKIIFYLDAPDVDRFPSFRDLLGDEFKKRPDLKIIIYTGGYRDWLNRRAWLGEAKGYRIETSAPPALPHGQVPANQRANPTPRH